MSREHYIAKRIEMIEHDLEQFKSFVEVGNGKTISLRGLWKGSDISDEMIDEAKRSLFKGIEFDEPRHSEGN